MTWRIRLAGLIFCGAFSVLGAENSALELLAQGRSYFFGENGKAPNPALGAYYYRKAAEAGNARAQYNFAACCEHGWGVTKSPQLAYFWYCRAAEQELTEAVIAQSRMLFRGLAPEKHEQQDFPALAPDREKALALLRKTSAAGSGEAAKNLAANLCLMLGEHPEYGQEIHTQAALAVQRLGGDADAKLLLATVYQNGIGGFFKPELAVALLEQSVQLNSFEAKSRLAEALEYGHGCEMDPARSLKLDQEAAQQQIPRSLLRMGKRYLYGSGVEQDHAKAVAYFQGAFASAYPGSARMLGNCFRDGLGVEQNYETAAAFYELEAKAQDAPSLYELGNLYRDGLGVEQDLEKAALCYHQAAQLDHAPSQRELALALIAGRGVKKDVLKAAELLQSSARSGDRQAAEILKYNQLEY